MQGTRKGQPLRSPGLCMYVRISLRAAQGAYEYWSRLFQCCLLPNLLFMTRKASAFIETSPLRDYLIT